MSATAPRSRLRVEVVSDVVCPWCLIGTRRLELALAAAGVADADVEFRPFLLDPATPPEGEDLRGRLRRKYGNPEPMFARVEAAARQSGIELDFAKVRRAVSAAIPGRASIGEPVTETPLPPRPVRISRTPDGG